MHIAASTIQSTLGQASPQAAEAQAPASQTAPANAPTSADATTVDALRLRLVDEIAKLIAQGGSSQTASSLAQSLGQDPEATLLQLAQELARRGVDSNKNEPLTQQLRALLDELQPISTSLGNEIQSRLDSNQFSGLSPLLEKLAHSLNALPGPQAGADARQLMPLLNAVRELSSLGLPAEISAESLRIVDQAMQQKTSIPLDTQSAATLREVYQAELASFPASPYGQSFHATLTRVDPHSLELDGQVAIALPAQSGWDNLLKTGERLEFSLNSQPPSLQPWPASAQIPAEEQAYWTATGLPPTPATSSARDTLAAYGTLPADPSVAGAFGQALHELSLYMPDGVAPDTAQRDLLLRTLLLAGDRGVDSSMLQSLSRYHGGSDPEIELLRQLPEESRQFLMKELGSGKAHSPQQLQEAVEKALAHSRLASPETTQTLQNIKEQLQWTRLDQDTRHPAEREQVFYWQHEGELQKGRLKVKDERRAGHKSHSPDAAITFSVQTQVSHLGKVQADLVLQGERLDVRLADEEGEAEEAVRAERESLATELSEMGLSLGELVYGALRLPVISARPLLGGSSPDSRLDLLG